MVKVVQICSDIEEIVPGFIEGRNKDVTLLKEHIGSGNIEEIQTIGHKMKGNAGSYGFDEMGVIGAKIEEAAKQNDLDTIKEQTQELENYLSEIEIEYVD